MTELKLANIAPRLPEGALSKNLFWWCVSKDGTPVMAYLMCAKGHDCIQDQLALFLTNLYGFPEDKKLSAADTAWAANVTYDCYAPAIVAKTDWQGLACKETRDFYAANKATWEAGYTPEAASMTTAPASAAATGSQVFLYYGTTYSGVTGFDTVDACYRYAKNLNLTQAYTCVTRTTFNVTKGAAP